MKYDDERKIHYKFHILFLRTMEKAQKELDIEPMPVRLIYMFKTMNPNNDPTSVLELRQAILNKQKLNYVKHKLLFTMVTKKIKKLHSKGYIKILNCEEVKVGDIDKRVKYVQLTEKSLSIIEAFEKIMKKEWENYEQ